MSLQKMQVFIVRYSINFTSGKKWITEEEAWGITELGAIDTIEYLHRKKDISIISVKGTGKYSPLAAYGDNHTLGER